MSARKLRVEVAMSVLIRAALLCPCFAIACSTETPVPQPWPYDGGVDAGANADTGPRDTGPSDGGFVPDATPIDAGPGDESIRGTSLEGITIAWPDRLELCSSWREGRTADEELAVKVHLTLEPASRPSLGDGHLSRSTVSGVIRRGPLADHQASIPTTSATLVRYDLLRPTADTSVSADLEYTIAGGTIIEGFSVTRARGDTRPVVFGDFYEHTFAFRPSGSTEVAYLETCGGKDDLLPAIFYTSLEYQGRHASLVRFAGFLPSDAGSSPTVPRGGMLIFDDNPWDPIFFHGFWSQIYAAAHHNFDDGSRFDLTRDLGLYQTVYAPSLNGGDPIRPTMITRIDLDGVDGFGPPPTATMQVLDTATGQSTQEIWSATDWVRGDDAAVLEGATACAAPQALTLASNFSQVLQLVICPITAEPGFTLHKVLPLVFVPDPAVVGAPIEGAALVPTVHEGRSGYRFDVGTHEVVVTKELSDEYYFFYVFDAQGQVIDTRLDTDIPLDGPPRDERITNEANGGAIRVSVTRRWAGQGVGESSIYAPVDFELTFDGQTHRVEAWDRLDYTNTHHNWLDRLVAKGDGLTMNWRVDWENGPLIYRVSATRDADGVVVLPETIVELVP
jgi:hypothetical protein